MPYTNPIAAREAQARWYAANKAAHNAKVTIARRDRLAGKPHPRRKDGELAVPVQEGWEERQRYALGIAKRRYRLLFERYRDDVRQVAAIAALSEPEIGTRLSRAVQRGLYQLERELGLSKWTPRRI